MQTSIRKSRRQISLWVCAPEKLAKELASGIATSLLRLRGVHVDDITGVMRYITLLGGAALRAEIFQIEPGPMFLSHTFFLTLLSSPGRNHHIFPIALPDADIHNAIFLILIPRNLVFKREGGKRGHISEGWLCNHFRQIAFPSADEQIFVNQLSNGKLE